MTIGDHAPEPLDNPEADHETQPRLRLVQIAKPPSRRTAYNLAGKPFIDIAIAALATVLLAPVMALVALAIRITMGNPVLYRQRRVGLSGKEFDVLKFRTMGHDRRAQVGPYGGTLERRRTHKHEDDPRHTPLGRVLRKWSLDELPQLFNVLRGEMSIVGPRPELVHIVLTYPDDVNKRHSVKPGLTGLWQVESRGDGLMHENPEPDLRYVDQQSFLLDLKIMLLTPGAILNRQGS